MRPRLGFIGLGWIGTHRMNALLAAEAAEVAGIFDPFYQGDHAFESVDSLLAAEDLDGVVIATPSALHAEQSIAALRQGHAVFCQKPLGRNAAEVDEILSASKATDRLLGVDLSYRHLRGMEQIQALLSSGALGKIFAAELVFHNAYGPDKPWFHDPQQSGGGCVMDLGIHLVDAVLWLLGGEPSDVSSRLYSAGERLGAKPTEVEDFATARFQIDGKMTVNLSCSWRLHAGRDAVIEIALHGTKGGVAIRNVDGSFYNFRVEHFTGTSSAVLAEPPDEWGGRAIVAWAQQLTASASYDPAIESQLKVARVLDAIYQAGP